jgi:prepilin-type processing-associated H-X9-DG protein
MMAAKRIANCRTTRKRNCQRGLTLVEVVFVTFIILFFSFLVIPWCRYNRESARRASCANAVRQIGLACKQYAVDNKDQFPSNATTEARAVDCFALLTNQYMAPGKVYNCASDRSARSGATFEECTNSYCYVTLSEDGRRPLSESESSSQPLILDKGLEGNLGLPVTSRLHSKFSTAGTNPHYGEGANVYFVGGHVKWITKLLPEISDGTNGYILRPQ